MNFKNLQKGRAAYQNGMRRAKQDCYNCGEKFVKSQMLYGLQGKNSAYYKGYRDYYNRYCTKL